MDGYDGRFSACLPDSESHTNLMQLQHGNPLKGVRSKVPCCNYKLQINLDVQQFVPNEDKVMTYQNGIFGEALREARREPNKLIDLVEGYYHGRWVVA